MMINENIDSIRVKLETISEKEYIVKQQYHKQLNELNELNEEMLKTFAMTCCGEVCCLTAAFGGIIAQEVLKACSNKFTPIHQFMYYDAFEALPERENHGM